MGSSTAIRAACVAALLLGATSEVHAGWKRPAAGQSASGDPEVLFTFDDGPHEIHTKTILDELEARDVGAIFYWVGRRVLGPRSDSRRALVTRAVDLGHIVANHTQNHVHLCRVPEDTAATEIDANAALFEQLTGLPILLFRAPYGNHCRRLVEMLDARSLSHLHWDIDPREYLHHDSARTASYVINRLRRLDGRAVVLMHDTKLATARALPRILDWIDAENQRRRQRGERPIRILSGSDFVAETYGAELGLWLRDIALTAADELREQLTGLVPGARDKRPRGPVSRG